MAVVLLQRCPLIYLALVIAVAKVDSVAIDNGVVGQPIIDCADNSISVSINTQQPFEGKIYVKGESTRPECVNGPDTGSSSTRPSEPTTRPSQCPPCPACFPAPQYGSNSGSGGYGRSRRQSSGGSVAHLTLTMGTCGMKRERQLSPVRGVSVQFTVVISFHSYFVTKVDRAYLVRCFYQEAEKTVTSELNVSMQPTTELIAQAQMPVCQYSVRRGAPDGPVIRYTQVGDAIFHRWECSSEPPDVYGILIHSCYVNDGQGQRVPVLDERGCPVDPVLMGNVVYASNSSMLAYSEQHVFKFADRSGLDFQCAISVCLRGTSGSCLGITPPQCPNQPSSGAIGVRLKRTLLSSLSNLTQPQQQAQPPETVDYEQHDGLSMDVSAQHLNVFDIDTKMDRDELHSFDALSRLPLPVFSGANYEYSNSNDIDAFEASVERQPKELCLSVAGFGIIIALCSCVFTGSAVVTATLYILKVRL